MRGTNARWRSSKRRSAPRKIGQLLTELAHAYPVVAITGPRQAGKTTLARAAFADKPYVSLENPSESASFNDDPQGFFARFPNGAVFDEVQRAPQLPSYLQGIVDADRRMGRFVLTGSQQLGMMDRITQSLAGRVALVELLPFSREELDGAGIAPASVDETLMAGGYPPIYDRPVSATRWYGDYLATYVERDVRQVLALRDLAAFSSFVRLCAAHVTQQVNYDRWARDIGVDAKTLRAWLGVLEASYIVLRLRPHHRNFRKRTVKTPKLYFLDTGLACRLLDITEVEHVRNHPLRGALFENWVVSELLKGRTQRGLPNNLFYWRSRDGLEVDVIAEHGIMLQPVEIKLAATPKHDLVAGIERFAALASEAAEPATVVYGGEEARTIKGVQLLPWNRISELSSLV